MKVLLVWIVSTLILVSSVVADDLPIEIEMIVYCDTYKTVISNLMVDYSEQLIWEGQHGEAFISVYTNSRTGSWTIVRYDEDKIIACLSGSGIGYHIP